jgi:multimeric flavodoxin WrbA
MKILLVLSSPRREKSSTFLLAQEVLKGLSEPGVEAESIHLADCHIQFCRHCEECHKKILLCSVKDGMEGILKKMLAADGIIIASPNYINQVTASMKALFDRSSHFIHCKRLLGKYIAGVVTSGSGRDGDVLDYIEYYSHACGAQFAGGVSSAADKLTENLAAAAQLGKELARDIKEKRVFADQMKVIEAGRKHFKRIIQLRKDDWQEEYAYWRGKGWL